MDKGYCNKALGFYGKETPIELIQSVLAHASRNYDNIEGILINGDFVQHGVALTYTMNEKMNKTWETIKGIMKANMDAVKAQFPNVDVFPVIGNNDVIVHNQVPCNESDASVYYPELFDIWFPQGKMSSKFNYTSTRDTFLKGGYYFHKFNDDVTLLALNSMYFMRENYCQLEKGTE
jgi:hypothetical protein